MRHLTSVAGLSTICRLRPQLGRRGQDFSVKAATRGLVAAERGPKGVRSPAEPQRRHARQRCKVRGSPRQSAAMPEAGGPGQA